MLTHTFYYVKRFCEICLCNLFLFTLASSLPIRLHIKNNSLFFSENVMKIVAFHQVYNIIVTVTSYRGGLWVIVISARTYGLTRITVIERFGGYCYGQCGSKENRQKQNHTLQTLFSTHTF